MSYLLKFTTPFGIPVGVLKAGRSFSPSLMAFTRNTCKGRSTGHHEWGWVGAIPAPCRSCPWLDPGAASAEWEGALRRALESDRLGCEPGSSHSRRRGLSGGTSSEPQFPCSLIKQGPNCIPWRLLGGMTIRSVYSSVRTVTRTR